MAKRHNDEKILEARDWKVSTGSTWDEAAKKFKFTSGGNLAQVIRRIGERYAKDGLTIKKAKKKNIKSPAVLELELNPAPNERQVAIMVVPLSQVKGLVASLWQ